MRRLVASLADVAPGRTLIVLVSTLALSVSSGVGLLMLVPLLGVAGLDVGDGSIGLIAETVTGALQGLGMSLTVPSVLAVYVAVVIADAGLQRFQSLQSAALYHDYVVTLRRRLHGAITGVGWASYVRQPSSRFMHELTSEVERVGGATSGLLALAAQVVMAALYFGLALFVSPGTTVLVVVFGSALMTLLVRKTRLGRVKGEVVSVAYHALYDAISEHLAGMRITKGHGIEAQYVARFRERTRATADAQIDVARNQANVGFWLKVGSATIMAGLFGVALLVLDLPLASILLLLYLFGRLVPMLTGIQRQVQGVLALMPAFDRVVSTLSWLEARAEPRVRESPVSTFTDQLRLEAVRFSYRDWLDDGDSEPMPTVLHDVDVCIRAGRTTAIVGPSGGGKSTVADIVVGLLTPTGGRVTLDGTPLEGGRVHAWRRQIGYVNQDTFLFNDSVRENLLVVRPDAGEDELRGALRAASATFVDTLPQGLDTVVGDRGVRLSGGERQRIALARAILRQPLLLVLDEATSALDSENERVIQAAIERMAGKLTILVIAHRLASVRGAGVIYVMEDGRVVESGNWDELLRAPRGRFRELCRAQGLPVEEDTPSDTMLRA